MISQIHAQENSTGMLVSQRHIARLIGHRDPREPREVMRVTDREHRYSEMKSEKNHSRTM